MTVYSIEKLKNYNTRMKTAISELERLEDDIDFLMEIEKSYGEIVRKCEDRREFIQRRKYGR
ncbi:hypothetical protein [Methanobrevibacter sp.]|uniref:hypothetical protein n=1 Tax=Methanobrevibacter sp. TaxID=66852 RepID=UPI0038649201